MIRRQQITLLDRVVTTWYVEREHAFNNQHNVAVSQLLICPRCQKTWAKLEFDNDRCAWPTAQFCELCNEPDDWIPVPGSLLNEEGWGIIDDSLLAALPEELVHREFLLHLKVYQSCPPRQHISPDTIFQELEALKSIESTIDNSTFT